MKSSFSLGKAERLQRRVEFQRVYSQGKSFKEDHFRFYVLKRSPGPLSRLKQEGSSAPGRRDSEGSKNRVGFVVGKRVGKAATKRNRVKRLLREAYRLNKGRLKEGWDLVLVAKEGAGELSFPEIEEIVLRLFRKAGLINKHE